MSEVWLITGCSTGFGRELSKAVIKNGDKVAVTARKIDDTHLNARRVLNLQSRPMPLIRPLPTFDDID